MCPILCERYRFSDWIIVEKIGVAHHQIIEIILKWRHLTVGLITFLLLLYSIKYIHILYFI